MTLHRNDNTNSRHRAPSGQTGFPEAGEMRSKERVEVAEKGSEKNVLQAKKEHCKAQG